LRSGFVSVNVTLEVLWPRSLALRSSPEEDHIGVRSQEGDGR
jgi:hypothetical protein